MTISRRLDRAAQAARHLRTLLGCLLSLIGSAALAAADSWTEASNAVQPLLDAGGLKPAWPGGCSGVVVNRLTGDVTIKVVGTGLWRSPDQGKTWRRVDGATVSGRDETGWATSVDQNAPDRIASFSLDGTAAWTVDGTNWTRFTDLGRNWDFGSVDWGARVPKTIIAAKHETTPPGEVYLTTDGGTTWRKLAIELGEIRGRVGMVGALGAATLIYSKGEGILRSTDSGATWARVAVGNPQTRIPVLFRGRHYLGTSTGLLVSRDQGASWQEQGAAVGIWQGPFFGRDEAEMAVVGKEGVFLTRDAGASWTRVAELKSKEKGFLFTANWFGCYAWDPVHHILYASAMGNPVYRLDL